MNHSRLDAVCCSIHMSGSSQPLKLREKWIKKALYVTAGRGASQAGQRLGDFFPYASQTIHCQKTRYDIFTAIRHHQLKSGNFTMPITLQFLANK